MKKVTDLKKNEVIHVRTEAEDLAIRTLMHEAGLRWKKGNSYLEASGADHEVPNKTYEPASGMYSSYDYSVRKGEKIYPASDFLEPSIEDLTDQLKKAAEAKGLSAEVVFKEKDIWEGVEFVDRGVAGWSICRFDRIDDGFVWYINGKGEKVCWLNDGTIKPSTESAYVEQLKAEAKKRFGEIKEGDRFKEPDGYQLSASDGYDIFEYHKESDKLLFKCVIIYQSGKWAERVKERVGVKWVSSSVDSKSIHLGFELVGNHGMEYGDQAGEYLAKCLEEYLNKE